MIYESLSPDLLDADRNGFSDIFLETGDSLAGGSGDDVYEVRSALDIVAEEANAGVDTVRTALSITSSSLE